MRAQGLPEFLALNSFLRSAAKSFAAFRQMQASSQEGNTITLNMNQWVYAAASTV